METRKGMEEYQEVIARDDRRDDLREKQGRCNIALNLFDHDSQQESGKALL